MSEYVSVIAIPRYDHVLAVADVLNGIHELPKQLIKETQYLSRIVTRMPKNRLNDLRHVLDKVDLLAVKYLEKTALEDYAPTKKDGELALFSPRAQNYDAVMTGKPDGKIGAETSAATYSWMIEREEPVQGDPVCLLLQHLSGRTSAHYHEKTLEFMLALRENDFTIGMKQVYDFAYHPRVQEIVRQTMETAHRVMQALPVTRSIEDRFLPQLLPKTAQRLLDMYVETTAKQVSLTFGDMVLVPPGVGHQLGAENGLNVLGMYPQDFSKKDHLYLQEHLCE